MIILFSSCASEEIAIEKNNTSKVEKTVEMKNFENTLKNWMLSKKQLQQNSSTTVTTSEESIEKASSDLLLSIGMENNKIMEYKAKSTEALVFFAMDEYLKSLNQKK